MSLHRRLLQITSIIVTLTIIFSGYPMPSVSAQGKDGLKRQVNPQTGRVSFLGPENGHALPASQTLGLASFDRPADPALALAKRFGSEFGLRNPERDLKEMKSHHHQAEDGRITARYQQHYQGVPVIGAELIVNTDDNGDLYSMNGEVSPDLSLSIRPTIDSEQARQSALRAVAKWYHKTTEDFVASEPELWIYDESLLQPGTRPAELVWRMEVTPKDAGMPVRELVLVDAQRGSLSLHLNQIDTGWSSPRKNNPAQAIQPTSTPPLTETLEPVVTEVRTQATTSDQDALVSNTSISEVTTLTTVTWYVATTGSNANSCSTAGNSCQTINGAIGKAAAGDTIKVAVGTYTGTGTEVVLINKSVTLSSGWNASFTAQSEMSIIDGQSARRGVTVSSGVIAVIERSVVQNGNALQGSGIYNNTSATVTLNNSIISSNTATWGGGAGIYNNPSATATLNNSTIINSKGTGIDNYGTLVLNNSTVSGSTNSGIFNSGGTLVVNNSTLSGNTATGSGGGGILNESGTTTLNNSTVSGNTTTFGAGGGIYNLGGPITLKNTIIAGNSARGSGPDCSGSIGSAGYNLIGSTSGCTFASNTGDLINSSPTLGELIGTPGYYSLQAGSPAIDAGNPAVPGSGGNACLAKDERGVTRPVGARCDIGAYEYTVPGSVSSLSIFSGDSQRAAPGFVFLNPLKVVVLDNQGSPVPSVSITFTAPGSGASGTFASTGTRTMTASTNSSGIATTSTFTANALSGSYTIVASASGVGSVNFNLQNISWYVATTGSNANNCQTPATSCATINGVLVKAGFMPDDTVLVAEGTYTGSDNPVALLNKNVRLSGGWNALFTTQIGQSTIDGESVRSGVTVNPEISATIERFVVQNGLADYDGGGIYNGGSLVLNNSLVQNNSCCIHPGSSSNGGGGIGNFGVLTVNNSTITGNHAYVEGGSSYQGGGLFNYNGTLTVNNSTISNNEAGAGGGIFSYSTVVLNNSTINGNRVIGYGGGIDFYNDFIGTFTFTVRNTLMAGNVAETSGPDCMGPISSAGYNLIGNNTSCSFSATTGDLVGTSASPINPRLTLLQDNGGLTFTQALITGSPAINVGNPAVPGSGGNACLATDQRGVVRLAGARCDIGAYEGSVQWSPPYLISTYTANRTSSLPGSFLCDQTDPTCFSGDFHAKTAHKYAIGTYNLYATQHGRNSIDNNGMKIISTVHYCDPDFACPYDNAFWNGEQMVYGDAHSYPLADDVVAHELTHGVTQHESNLFYYYQSGAINESFSDLWGEYYDQTNGLGNDSATVKWLHAEDVIGRGPYRSMINPPTYGDPDKMSSPNYYEGEGDNGGVHFNSGINNKAVYLMVDGGTFNGKTVTGLGWTKTAAIYYEVNTNLLSSGADYSDLYYALQQACTNLVGQKGITIGDCVEVKDAVDAVEMNNQPTPNFNTDAPYCNAGNTMTALFSDDLESGTANWTFTNGAYPRWQVDSPYYGPYAQSGLHSLYADDYPAVITDASAKLKSFVVPSNAYLHFAQAYDFETSDAYYDGGVLEYSLNNGSTWTDAGALIEFNGYTGTLFTGAGNPLSGRSAFVGASHGYISTRLNLAVLAGQSVTFRWRMGLDQAAYAGGWWVDNIKVYSCNTLPPTAFNKSSPANGGTGVGLSATISWASSSFADYYQYCYDLVNDNQCNRTWSAPLNTTSADIANLGTNTTYYWQVRAVNAAGTTSANNQTWGSFTTTSTLPAGLDSIETFIGIPKEGKYSLGSGKSLRESYTGVNNGPVKIASTNAIPFIGAERVIYKVNNLPTSFSEMMALPNGQLDNTYWLPWYNNVDLDTQLRFGNVSNTTATVHVWIGGQEMTSCNSPYTLAAGASLRVSCPGVNNGPVQIISNVNIVAAERVIYNINGLPTSFSEMMALPASQLNSTYWLPWYNNVDLDTQLRFGNVSETNATATVRLYIGGQEMTNGCTPSNSPYTLAAGASLRVSCPGVNSGPVKIVSDIPIVAAERVIYQVNNLPTSFTEMMALPASQLNSTYWLPWYNNVDLDTQLRFGNVSETNATATVHLYIGGQEMTNGCSPSNSPYILPAGASLRVSCSGVNNGPVRIVSDIPIVAAERVIYKVNNLPTSFSEMMALPNNQLNTAYWLPWYNNVDLDTQLRFGVP